MEIVETVLDSNSLKFIDVLDKKISNYIKTGSNADTEALLYSLPVPQDQEIDYYVQIYQQLLANGVEEIDAVSQTMKVAITVADSIFDSNELKLDAVTYDGVF